MAIIVTHICDKCGKTIEDGDWSSVAGVEVMRRMSGNKGYKVTPQRTFFKLELCDACAEGIIRETRLVWGIPEDPVEEK